jgi:parvulin-like peptidyl-prolyl isomerase
VSGVVESAAGYHVIQLIERRAGGTLPYAAAAPDIMLRLAASKREKAMRDLAAGLRARARIETYL